MKKFGIIIIILTIAIIIGIQRINASTITINSQQYSWRRINFNTMTEEWSGYVNNGTQTYIDNSIYNFKGFRVKFYSSQKFESGVNYQVKIRANTTPKLTYNYAQPKEEFSCYGSVTNSNYNPQQGYIESCQLVGIVIEDGNNFTDYIINIKTNTTVETLQFNIISNLMEDTTRVNIDNTSTITKDTTTTDAINSQTESIIASQQDQTTQIINNQNELLGNKCENIVDLSGFNTQSLNGITFINNNDGTITINGTATSSFGITFYSPTLTSGNYTFNSASINAYIYDYSSNTSILTNGETNKIINGNYNNIGLDTWINSGQVFNNVIFKPMITKSSNVKSFCKYGTYTSKQDTTNDLLSQEHTYNNNASENIDGTQINNYGEQQQDILDNIDLNIEDDLQVTINPNASNFIWNTVNSLRAISSKIVLLFTSVLSLGLIKMVLNR